jgi:Rod binding domain-containing protein
MAIFGNDVFARPVIGSENTKANRSKAAHGFTQVFTTMLAGEMRKAASDGDKGPLGTAGGASGNIYGSFFDQTMGSTLAHSKAMKPLSEIVESGMSAPTHPIARAIGGPGARSTQKPAAGGIVKVSYEAAARGGANVFDGVTTLSGVGTELNLPSDARGPVMLPPAPTSMAPILPPPSSVKG